MPNMPGANTGNMPTNQNEGANYQDPSLKRDKRDPFRSTLNGTPGYPNP